MLKKYLITVLFLMCFAFVGGAQIVNIPDANFKHALVNTNCVDTDGDGVGDADADSNDDGEVELSEALAVDNLHISNAQINNLSAIENFQNLEKLVCSSNNFNKLAFPPMSKLRFLDCSQNWMFELNLDSLPKLTELYILQIGVQELDLRKLLNLEKIVATSAFLSTFEVQGLNKLKTLDCGGCQLSNLNLNGLNSLTHLTCGSNNISSLDLSNLINLKYLHCENNSISSLDLTTNIKLEDLSCSFNPLNSFDINHLENLKNLFCNGIGADSLKISNLAKLSLLSCRNNNLKNLDINAQSNIYYINCAANQLSALDASNTTILTTLNCQNNKITNLNLKNGKAEAVDFSNNPIDFICCDPAQLQDIQNQAIANGQNPIINTSCIQNGPLLQGQFKKDTNLNCLPDTSEITLSGRIIKAQKTGIDTFYAITNSAGNYQLGVDTGQYLLSAALPNNYYALCMDSITVDVTSINDTAEVDFLLQPLIDCPLLEVNIAATQMRRCFQNKYIVQYCNVGPAQAPNAQVTVTLSDDVAFLSSSIPGTNISGTDWQFSLGNVESEACGSFTVDFEVLCDSTVLGQSICATAHITPDSICTDSTWSGAEVMVDGDCEGDSVRFVIRNVGTGNMTDNVDFVVIEDIVIFRMGSFNLPANDSLVIKIPANGSTYRLRAGQEPTFPFNSMPTASVEGCGQNLSGLVSLGFVSQFGEDDGNPFYSVDCSEVVGSYDPNDKSAQPTGVGTEHYIYPETPIDYTIRFQNTGTDTAFTVVIRDTLSPWLDMETFQAGISDHSYEVTMEGNNVLVFTYKNIMLPDSNINEPLSHGFLRFQITPKSTTPLGTVVENSAGIYFDFNEPIITNTVFHTVDTGFLQVQLVSLFSEKTMTEQRVYPNPVRAGDVLFFENMPQGESHISLTNPLGRVVFEAGFYGNRVILPMDLGKGLYFLEWCGADGNQRWGRIVVR